jgi:hypothetical protein
MKYKVVPFIPMLDQNKRSLAEQAAEQLENTVRKYSSEGWSYVRLESITTWVAPVGGCFGFGTKPGYLTARQVIVFEASE